VKEISNSMIQTNLQSNVCPENTFKSAKERLLAPHAKRKFSYPVSLQASTFLSDAGSLSARRRLSNGKCLCGQYIRSRLKRSGIFNKKLGLQRLRSIIGTPAAHVVREVFPALNYIGEELERMHPKLYTSVTRQISRKAGGELSSAESASVLLSSVARDLFRNDITWGKVVSLFAITGGLAVDCVRQGHAEYLTQLVEGIAAVIEDELVAWINENGGWIGLTIHVRPESSAFSVSEWSAIFVGCFTGFFIGFQIVPKIFFK
ncbi:Bcl-2-related ovarian killer protein like A, partial [Pseudolycoriella hygida]